MRKLLILITFVSSLILLPTTSSYADWTKVAENVTGDSYYIDFERVRKHKGLVYYWQLSDYLKPTQYGTFSAKSYREADCVRFRLKYLSFVHHKQPMGRDTGDSNSPKDPEWVYPPPDSVMEITLKSVCNHKP